MSELHDLLTDAEKALLADLESKVAARAEAAGIQPPAAAPSTAYDHEATATIEPPAEAPATPVAGYSHLYDDSGIHSAVLDPPRPFLTGGSAATDVAELVQWLNGKIGSALPIADEVTTDVLTAVRTARAVLGIPAEQGVAQAENWIGANLWAAVNHDLAAAKA